MPRRGTRKDEKGSPPSTRKGRQQPAAAGGVMVRKPVESPNRSAGT